MRPMTETSHYADKPARLALEMNPGWLAKHGIKAGFTLKGQP